jgi:hypothetical protein
MEASSTEKRPSVTECSAYLRKELKADVADHKRKSAADSVYHNLGTAIALAATTTATVLPASLSTWARIASGLATFLIALARALDFGARWRWHLRMKAKYTGMLYRVEKVQLLPSDEQSSALQLIFDELVALHKDEAGIPGSSELSPGAAQPAT